MQGTVASVVRACEPCARAKAGFRQFGKELQPLPLQGLMFRWEIDFSGPLPESDRWIRWILVCIDHCTKWVEILALSTKYLAGVARSFSENVLARYGAPGEVLTNRGTEFLGEFQTLLSNQ